ncbi:CAM1 [Symbiodinium natans]|uniref:Calmodulin n=1 Tax=Symbiodinium natans TaxID=878477 RepID=A0A812L6F9_9DINO|nr:CAM1 [Symbiodinium natans]
MNTGKQSTVEHFRKGFSDYDADGSGSISTLELSDIFREFGYRISVEALHHYIDRVDEDGSNQLDFREFLRLMRWHRESELDNYKKVYANFKVAVDDYQGIPGKKLARAIEELKAIGDRRIIDSEVDRLPSDILIDFDMFVDIVDACRFEFVKQEKKKAGFTDEELQIYVDQFKKFDRDGSGGIEGKELLKLLEAHRGKRFCCNGSTLLGIVRVRRVGLLRGRG